MRKHWQYHIIFESIIFTQNSINCVYTFVFILFSLSVIFVESLLAACSREITFFQIKKSLINPTLRIPKDFFRLPLCLEYYDFKRCSY